MHRGGIDTVCAAIRGAFSNNSVNIHIFCASLAIRVRLFCLKFLVLTGIVPTFIDKWHPAATMADIRFKHAVVQWVSECQLSAVSLSDFAESL